MVIHKLVEFNTHTRTRIWDRYTLKDVYVIGRYGNVGTHVHVVQTEVVVAETGEHKPGTFKVGDVFSSAPVCNSRRGQHGAQPFFNSRWDLVNVTCKKCQYWLWGDGPRPIGVVSG